MTMTVIDRFEGEYAVLETESGMKRVLRDVLPVEVREGDVLEIKDGIYTVNKKAAAERRSRISGKLKKLRK